MKFTIISELDEGLGLAVRLQDEGHTVTMVVVSRGRVTVGKGLVKDRWTGHGLDEEGVVDALRSFDSNIFVVTHPRLKDIAASLRKGGTRVVGPFESVGETTGFEPFTITMMFDGVNVWNDVFLSIRDVKFLPGNLGPNTSGEGISTWRIHRSHLGEFVRNVERNYRQTSYQGLVVFGEESTNIDVLYTIFELSRRPLGEIIVGLAHGTRITLGCGVSACAARMSLPPWPYGSRVLTEGRQLDVEPPALKHIWLQNVYKDDGGLKVANGSSTVLWASAYGSFRLDGSSDAPRRVVKTLKNVGLDEKQFRVDVCKHKEFGLDVSEMFLGGVNNESRGEEYVEADCDCGVGDDAERMPDYDRPTSV